VEAGQGGRQARGAVTVTPLLITALIFITVALAAALIAWCLRPPAHDPFFIPFGEVPVGAPAFFAGDARHECGVLADPSDSGAVPGEAS
jgi:hypothetical protein